MSPTAPESAASQKRPPREASKALARLIDVFESAGWTVREPADVGERHADLMIRRGATAYVVELKVASEGRADRLVPLWSQAFLQAQRFATADTHSLAVVAAPSISERVLRQIADFVRRNVPDAAFGVVDDRGLRHFEGRGLEGLNAHAARAPMHPRGQPRRANLFTDINQWLLKVLLAPEIPAHLTGAPRGEYRNATELARAARVSVMSAFRLIETLRADGHLDDGGATLRVVRRRELLERWRAWASAQVPNEVPVAFVLPGDPRKELRAVLNAPEIRAALGMFAAADALQLGFVRGVPPHVYLPALTSVAIDHLSNVAVIEGPGERPDLILRAAPAVQSIFRAAVPTADGLVTDVVQTWIDVSSHPARGREQADVIERRALSQLFEER